VQELVGDLVLISPIFLEFGAHISDILLNFER